MAFFVDARFVFRKNSNFCFGKQKNHGDKRMENLAEISRASKTTVGSSNFHSGEEILSVVENAPVNIMVCDLDLVIQYVNPKSFETLKSIENFLPCKADKVLGKSIDFFHKNPAHQRKLLASDSNLPHRATISLGPEKLDLLVSAVYDSQGNYSSIQVVWDVVTDRIRIENEMANFTAMVENAPVNIMMCDLDLKLTYMNPKSKNTLKKVEHLLPIPVDQVVGNSIDLFHKNPSVQRKLLGNVANLPHRATIQLGPETLDLNASAIFDRDGEHMGSMVTWDIITSKVELTRTLEETALQLSSAAEELTATATQMSDNAQKTSADSNTAAAAAEEVAQGVQAVATNTEEMTSSIKEIAKSSSQAAEMSKESKRKCESTNATIDLLGTSSQEIGKVIKVISTIAEQTNLLALNATIEAARAGDAGKGFAVVANEVKELAKQTATATEEITLKIESIQASTKDSVEAIAEISASVDNLNNISVTIAAAVEEQTATTNEVSRIVAESNQAVRGIAETIKTVSSTADQNNTGADNTLEAAKGLSQLATKLQQLVQELKEN